MTFSKDLGKLVFPIVVVAGLAVFGYFFFKAPHPGAPHPGAPHPGAPHLGLFTKVVAFLIAAFFIVLAAVVPPLAEFVSGRKHPL